MSKINFDEIFEIFRKENDNIQSFGKTLGKGAYGEVRDAKLKTSVKTMAAKLIMKKKNDERGEIYYANILRGQNIVKVNLTEEKEIKGNKYDLIIMEKSLLNNLEIVNKYYHNNKILKLIFNQPFEENVGNNLLRFYTKQIVNGLETLQRNYLVHFDIKPDNLLISLNLEIKLSDFSLLTKVKEQKELELPGGTQGFSSPEYYLKKNFSKEEARKQDFFALGSTLFYLKYGTHMLKFNKCSESPSTNYDIIKDILEKKIAYIKSNQFNDQDFIDFISGLIEYDPGDRPTFEQIYRNKWLNKSNKILKEIIYSNNLDIEKAMMELQKSDFLIKKEKESNKKKEKKFKFKKWKMK